jgi:CRP/FNR family transcriptional regulator, cyclic AMP receptor protein
MNSSTEQREGPKPCGFNHALDILRDLPLLSGVPLEVIKVLAYLAVKETFAPGERLCEQGEPLDHCFALLEGEVAVTRRSGDTEAVLFHLGEGSFIGGLGLLSSAKSLFSVRAVSEACCLVLTKEKFLKTAERFPEMLPKLLANVVNHVFRWEEAFMRSHAEECADRGKEMGLSLF